jgi:galactokinase/mevalonate kinase-like predicted kinase
VKVAPLRISTETLSDLEENLLLFFTGYSRLATEILEDQHKRPTDGDSAIIDNLHFVKELGIGIKTTLENGYRALWPHDAGALGAQAAPLPQHFEQRHKPMV